MNRLANAAAALLVAGSFVGLALAYMIFRRIEEPAPGIESA